MIRALWLVVLSSLMMCLASVAEQEQPPKTTVPIVMGEEHNPADEPPGYVARFGLNNPEDVNVALKRAEQIYQDSGLDDSLPPIIFIIHGPEAAIFLKENYSIYKEIVDRAARLSAFKVIDVKVCETRLGVMQALDKPLHPFVGTVKLGPAEIERLRQEEQFDLF
ncbi:acyl-CoA transferase [Porticoccaceae bacterium LTM1]|nr:acyl-CoA transferase [Porticoccaceae bacterium LTM1]